MTLAERLDQRDLAGQMFGRVGRDAVQFVQQLRGDALGLEVLHAVDDAMSHSPDRCEDRLRFEPVEQEIRGRAVVGGGQRARRRRGSAGVVDPERRIAYTDAIDLAVESAPERVACLVHREPNARRPAVEHHHARRHGCHVSRHVERWLIAGNRRCAIANSPLAARRQDGHDDAHSDVTGMLQFTPPTIMDGHDIVADSRQVIDEGWDAAAAARRRPFWSGRIRYPRVTRDEQTAGPTGTGQLEPDGAPRLAGARAPLSRGQGRASPHALRQRSRTRRTPDGGSRGPVPRLLQESHHR